MTAFVTVNVVLALHGAIRVGPAIHAPLSTYRVVTPTPAKAPAARPRARLPRLPRVSLPSVSQWFCPWKWSDAVEDAMDPSQYLEVYEPPAALEEPLVHGTSPSALGIRKHRHAVDHESEWTRAVHVWFVNKHGDVLMQKRDVDEEYAGKWDVSCHGDRCAPMSTSSEAAVKEIGEDIGLKMDERAVDAAYWCTLPHAPFTSDGLNLKHAERRLEYQDIFVVQAPESITHLRLFRTREVIYVPAAKLFEAWEAEDPNFVWRPRHYAHELEAAMVRQGFFGLPGWRHND